MGNGPVVAEVQGSTDRVEPLWVSIAKAKKSGLPEPPSNWQDVVSLPWRAVQQIPLGILKVIDKNFNHRAVPTRMLKTYFMGSGEDVLKPPKVSRGDTTSHTQKSAS